MGETAGWITIGTSLDTKQLERDIRTEEKRLQQFEKEATKLMEKKAKIELDLEDYYKQKELIEQSYDNVLKKAQTEEQVNNVLLMEQEALNSLNNAYSKQLNAQEEINKKIEENTYNQGLLNNKIQEMKDQLRKVKGYDKIKNSVDSIGNSVEKVVKKIGKWALAIFGVRSAYMFIRQSMSTLSQYDEQLATNIEYIRWALATTLKPLIEWIINAVYDLMSLIGDLIYSIFKVNIFANASADAFKKAKDSLSDSNKEAKKLQKSLAGFDEMNILQDNTATTSTGGTGGFDPFGDLAERQQKEKSGLISFWEDIIKFWEEDINDFIDMLDGNWATFFTGILTYVKGLWDILKGFGEIIIGLVEMIVGVVTGDFDLVKQGFDILIKGIKDILTGFFEMVIGTMEVVFGFIKGIVLSIWDFIYKNIIKPIFDFFGGIISTVADTIGKIFNKVKDKFDKLVSIVKAPFQGMIDLVTDLWSKIKKPIDTLVKNINKALDKINPINLLGDVGKGIGKGIGSIGKLFGFAKGGVVVPRLASGGIINQPGRGVPIASAIGGEAGMEGVIPLTDSQQMALLGEAIGRYITVDLTNITQLDGRQIARKVDKIQQNSNFVLNR